jgi:hypothetical protein
MQAGDACQVFSGQPNILQPRTFFSGIFSKSRLPNSLDIPENSPTKFLGILEVPRTEPHQSKILPSPGFGDSRIDLEPKPVRYRAEL